MAVSKLMKNFVYRFKIIPWKWHLQDTAEDKNTAYFSYQLEIAMSNKYLSYTSKAKEELLQGRQQFMLDFKPVSEH